MPTSQPLGAPPDGVSVDAFLVACAAIRGYCGWHIAPSITETIAVNGQGGVLALPTMHLTAVADMTSDGTSVTPQWYTCGVVEGFDSARWVGVQLTITHGYPDCPPEVLAVATAMASTGLMPRLARRETAGAETVEWTDAALGGAASVPDWARAILERYRLPARP